jgi:prepilin-type N-terminal cleavage/methylation domain-containing protein
MARNVFASLHPRKARSDERGMTLIEVLIALSIMGLVSVVFLGGIQMSFNSNLIDQERVTAENLVKSQMEYIKGQAYDTAHDPPQYLPLPIGEIPEGYYVAPPSAIRINPSGGATTPDTGIQQVTVRVYRGIDAGGRLLITVIGYKVNL